MAFAGKVWRLLVGIKDGLALIFLLLFFVALYMILASRPSPVEVREGALLLDLDGYVVEERSRIDPLEALLSQQAPVGEYQARDLVRALDAAATDERIQAVVLDLNGFLGGGQVHLQEIGASLDRVRAAGKPVLSHAMVYGDDTMLLAAHASEIWVDPQGGAFVAGPGGSYLFYRDLFDRFGVNAHVYQAGTYKSAVEPYERTEFSAPAREDIEAIYAALWEEWQANVKKARPKMDIALATTAPAEWVAAHDGDTAEAALAAGLVDKIGTRVEFGERVAEIVGEDAWDDMPGSFASSTLDAWLAENEPEENGEAIGVITVAGEIIDGDAGPGTAGAARIADLLDDALANGDLKGLVVRVDSPGGLMTGGEVIRHAILRHKAKGIPIAVSMANLAASGGYQVSTPADRIFAEPETVTGSIGVFAMLPTFEGTAAKLGITTDSIRTSPLSGQPGVVSGLTPEMDAIFRMGIENSYADFLALVAESRGKSVEEIDPIAQGRVWAGGAARQVGLVDQYGGLDDALAWVAKEAKLKDGNWHARFLGEDDGQYGSLIQQILFAGGNDTAGGDIFAVLARQQATTFALAASDLDRITRVHGAQAYCLGCPAQLGLATRKTDQSLWSQLVTLLSAE